MLLRFLSESTQELDAVKTAYERAVKSVPQSVLPLGRLVIVLATAADFGIETDPVGSSPQQLLASCPQLALLSGRDYWRFFPASLHHRLHAPN